MKHFLEFIYETAMELLKKISAHAYFVKAYKKFFEQYFASAKFFLVFSKMSLAFYGSHCKFLLSTNFWENS